MGGEGDFPHLGFGEVAVGCEFDLDEILFGNEVLGDMEVVMEVVAVEKMVVDREEIWKLPPDMDLVEGEEDDGGTGVEDAVVFEIGWGCDRGGDGEPGAVKEVVASEGGVGGG